MLRAAYVLAFWLGLPRQLAALAVTALHGLSQVHDYTLGLLAWIWIKVTPPRRPADPAPARPEGGPTLEFERPGC